MRTYSPAAPTCTFGRVPGPPTGLFFDRNARRDLRPTTFAPRTSRPPAKRKHRHDENDDDDETTLYPTTTGRVIMDANGNRVLVDGLKRMRVSTSPPTVPHNEDIAMSDETASIVPAYTTPTSHTKPRGSLLPSAQHAMRSFRSVPLSSSAAASTPLDVSDPSCRAMVVFDPHRALAIERSPRIQLVHESESETEPDEQPPAGVRFEELPDDDHDEPEAMELD